MDLRSPSHSSKSLGREKGKEARISSRRLSATNMWEINGLKSPHSLQGKDWKRIDKSGELFEPEFCKNKDRSGHHRRRLSSNSQKLQLSEYLEREEVDYAINGVFEVASTASIKTRLKNVSGSLSASKEMIKALFRLSSQEKVQNSSSRLTLVSALRVEIDRARHEVDQLMNQDLQGEKDTRSIMKRFAAEKIAWKKKEKERIMDAVSSVSRELEVERKLRRQSERLSKRLGKELAENKAELTKLMKKKMEEDEMEEKNAAIERLRSDLEAYLGGKQGFDNGSGNNEYGDDFGHVFDKIKSGSCQNEQKSEGEGDSDESELNSIELSMDSLSKSYTWSFAKDDDSVKASVDEVFKGRRSLSEKIQWENICLQRKNSECDHNNNNANSQGNSKRFSVN